MWIQQRNSLTDQVASEMKQNDAENVEGPKSKIKCEVEWKCSLFQEVNI
jgi:hypothetical protein